MAAVDYMYVLQQPASASDVVLTIENPTQGNISAAAGDLLNFADGEVVKIRHITGGFLYPLQFEVIRGVGRTKTKARKAGEVLSVFFRRNKMELVLNNGAELKLVEGYRVVSPIDKERYPERKGLEGPYRTKTGKVVYYDVKVGKYWDPDSDFYIPNERASELFNFTESRIEHDIVKLMLEEADVDFAPAAMDYAGEAPQHIIGNGKDSLKELYTFTIKIDGNDSGLKNLIKNELDSFAVSNNLLFWNLDGANETGNLIVRLQFRPNRLIELSSRRAEIEQEDVQDDLLICYNKLETWLKLLGCPSGSLVNALNLDVLNLHESVLSYLKGAGCLIQESLDDYAFSARCDYGWSNASEVRIQCEFSDSLFPNARNKADVIKYVESFAKSLGKQFRIKPISRTGITEEHIGVWTVILRFELNETAAGLSASEDFASKLKSWVLKTVPNTTKTNVFTSLGAVGTR